jgi:hypothetical protein
MSGEDRYGEALARLQEAEDEVVDAAIALVQADDRNEGQAEAYAALREAREVPGGCPVARRT